MENEGHPDNSCSEPAAISTISLSQALLAPLDAIFQAQIHAARSFLNMLLQIGYPHEAVDEKGKVKAAGGAVADADDKHRPYNQEFYYDVDVDGNKEQHKVSIPALALVPVAPLAIEAATFKLEMRVDCTVPHTQIQDSESEAVSGETGFDKSKRPWFLVSKPVSIMGNVAPPKGDEAKSASQAPSISIEIKVGKTSMPSGLDKLLTFLTQSSHTAKGGGQEK